MTEQAQHIDRRRGLRKRSVFLLGLVLGIVIWRWRYMVNTPVWLYRAALADRTDLYFGKTNGLANRDLVTTARSYLSQWSRAEGQISSVRLDPAWFNRHHPEAVDYNPFAAADEGNFRVTWSFLPGCQRVVTAVLSRPGPSWYDLKGQPCYDGYSVSVLMSPNLKPTAIKLAPLAALHF